MDKNDTQVPELLPNDMVWKRARNYNGLFRWDKLFKPRFRTL